MNVTHGVDSVARVINLLRRKKFEVENLQVESMQNNDSLMSITICDKPNLGVDQAVKQLSKLVDVYNIRGN